MLKITVSGVKGWRWYNNNINMRNLFLAEQGHSVELPAECYCFRNVTTQDSWQGL